MMGGGTTSFVREERPEPAVSRIVLTRAEKRNAQTKALLYELNDAFGRAAQNDDVKVVILAADGPDFSSGHDIGDRDGIGPDEVVGCWGGFELPGAEGFMAREAELYHELCWRWRDLPKPTIASVQGRVIAGGLMLVWPCDLVVAATNATFSDPVVAFGVNGHEFFLHPWELGPRLAKEMLFTGGWITASDAHRVGMVNRVVAPEDLQQETLALARRIATMPMMGLKLAKLSVNQAMDAQGQLEASRAAFGLHQLGHAHNRELFGASVDPAGARRIATGIGDPELRIGGQPTGRGAAGVPRPPDTA